MAEELNVLDSLEFPCDPSKLPTSKSIPVGDMICEIKAFKGTKSKPTEELSDEDRARGKVGGKVAIEVLLTVDEPASHRGIPHRHTFWIGSNDDPEATKAATWIRNGTDLMKMLQTSGVTVTRGTKPVEACAAAVGQKVGVHSYLKHEKQINPKTGEPYPDKVQVGSFWKPGTRDVRVQEPEVGGVEPGDAVAAAAASAGTFSSQD